MNVCLSCLRLCVNVDYLLLLYDFFLLESASKQGVERRESVGDREAIEVEANPQRLFCEIRIENPQFVLYENQFELKESNSLIVDVSDFQALKILSTKMRYLIHLF